MHSKSGSKSGSESRSISKKGLFLARDIFCNTRNAHPRITVVNTCYPLFFFALLAFSFDMSMFTCGSPFASSTVGSTLQMFTDRTTACPSLLALTALASYFHMFTNLRTLTQSALRFPVSVVAYCLFLVTLVCATLTNPPSFTMLAYGCSPTILTILPPMALTAFKHHMAMFAHPVVASGWQAELWGDSFTDNNSVNKCAFLHRP